MYLCWGVLEYFLSHILMLLNTDQFISQFKRHQFAGRSLNFIFIMNPHSTFHYSWSNVYIHHPNNNNIISAEFCSFILQVPPQYAVQLPSNIDPTYSLTGIQRKPSLTCSCVAEIAALLYCCSSYIQSLHFQPGCYSSIDWLLLDIAHCPLKDFNFQKMPLSLFQGVENIEWFNN